MKHKFKKSIVKLYSFWISLGYAKYVLFSIILTIVLTIPFAILYDLIGVDEKELGGPKIAEYGIGEAIVIAVIVAPILETLITQSLPIKLVQKYIKWHTNKLAIITSTLLFSLGHFSYSFWYFLLTIPIGFIFAITFVIFQKRPQSSFWTTSLIHAGKNAIAVLATFNEFTK